MPKSLFIFRFVCPSACAISAFRRAQVGAKNGASLAGIATQFMTIQDYLPSSAGRVMHAQSLLYRYRMYSLDNHCFAGQHMIKILNCKEVAARLNKSEKTLSTEMVRRPTSLPPWFKLPQSKKPLWLESTVDQFVLDQARKAGALPAPAEGKK